MAERIAHRELRNNSGEVLRNVAEGATYEITNHGKVVAILSPPGRGHELRITPARNNRPFSEITRVRCAESTESALDELRGDR
jgi:prevent-host-death family protein